MDGIWPEELAPLSSQEAPCCCNYLTTIQSSSLAGRDALEWKEWFLRRTGPDQLSSLPRACDGFRVPRVVTILRERGFHR